MVGLVLCEAWVKELGNATANFKTGLNIQLSRGIGSHTMS